jgi:hypothetical protein
MKLPDFIQREVDELAMFRKRVVLKQEFVKLYESPGGRDIVHALLRYCGIGQTSMAETSEQTAFNEGKRAVGLYLLSMMRVGKEEQMMKVLNERDTSDNPTQLFPEGREHG